MRQYEKCHTAKFKIKKYVFKEVLEFDQDVVNWYQGGIRVVSIKHEQVGGNFFRGDKNIFQTPSPFLLKSLRFLKKTKWFSKLEI